MESIDQRWQISEATVVLKIDFFLVYSFFILKLLCYSQTNNSIQYVQFSKKFVVVNQQQKIPHAGIEPGTSGSARQRSNRLHQHDYT